MRETASPPTPILDALCVEALANCNPVNLKESACPINNANGLRMTWNDVDFI